MLRLHIKRQRSREEALAEALDRWFVRPLARRLCAWCHGRGRYQVDGQWVTCKCALEKKP